MIELKNISHTFNPNTPMAVQALKNINLSIETGEFITVIGSNGAGKSTLLNVLAGDYFPDTGDVFIDQENVTFLPTERRAKYVGRIFQDPLKGSCENLTIEENLSLAYMRGKRRFLGRALSKSNRQFFQEKVAKLGLGLEHRLNEDIGTLSGGQRQALSLIMATLVPMKLFLLDEHSAALDPKMAEFVLELTQELVNDNNYTALMVTHSLPHALKYGTRTIMMHDGDIILDISGDERKDLSVDDLMIRFSKLRKHVLSDRTLLNS